MKIQTQLNLTSHKAINMADGSADQDGSTFGQLSSAVISKVFQTTSINALSAPAPYAMGTVPSGTKNFYPTRVKVTCLTATGVTVPAGVSVGTNNPVYNNVVSGGPLTGLNTAGTFISLNIINPTLVIPAGADIYAVLTAPASGTTMTIRVDIIGDYY